MAFHAKKHKRGGSLSDYTLNLGNALNHRKAQIAERAARLEAEQASRMKSSFIANMSHELRTPLNAIIGFSRMLEHVEDGKIPPDEISEYGGYIHEAAEHLLQVVNSILNISKIESGTTTLDVQDVCLREIIESAMRMVEVRSMENNIKLQQQYDENLPIVRGDPVRLQQVYTNLITNAIKFTPQGGSVSIMVRRFEDNRVLITIGDTGIGMNEEEVQIALRPFGQVNNEFSRQQEGTGLGLAIAKGLLEQHGGQLEITSEKGKGTIVATLLPIASEQLSNDQNDQQAA